MPNSTDHHLRLVVAAAIAFLALSACTAGGSATTTGPSAAGSSQPPRQSPGGGGGGSDGLTGSGIAISPPNPVDPADPGPAQARLVVPNPGQRNPRPVAPTRLEVSISGRHVLVRAAWYGGVEPCSVLDSVTVKRDGPEITIVPLEGIGDRNAVCIEIAVLKATIVDLGVLEAGTYRLTAPTGDARPVEFLIR